MRLPPCPRCPYSSVQPKRLRWFQWPLVFLLRRVYRCRSCQHDFIGRYFPFDKIAVWRWLM